MNERPLLIQFAKSAVAGSVKTRLTPPLTPGQAAHLHANMVVHTCTTLCGSDLGEVQLWLTGVQQQPLLQRCRAAGNFSLHQQCSGNLGARMAYALEAGLAQHERVILVGSDAPAIDVSYLQAANRALNRVDVVLGPARDGGYVLLGSKRFAPELFRDIEWGSGSVLASTLVRIRQLGWSLSLLPELVDIDRPEDLPHLPDTLSM